MILNERLAPFRGHRKCCHIFPTERESHDVFIGPHISLSDSLDPFRLNLGFLHLSGFFEFYVTFVGRDWGRGERVINMKSRSANWKMAIHLYEIIFVSLDLHHYGYGTGLILFKCSIVQQRPYLCRW